MDREAARVRLERGERRRPGDVRHPRPGLDRARDLGDRAIGDAQQAKLAVLTDGHAALAQSSCDRGTGTAAGPDDGDAVEHVAPAPSGCRAPHSLARMRVTVRYEGDARS